RKAVIGRPILYKTTKEFLLRFGLKDVNELPSMEEFEKLVAESFQSDLLPAEQPAQEAATPETSVAPEPTADTETKSTVDPEETAEISIVDISKADDQRAADDPSEEPASAGKND